MKIRETKLMIIDGVGEELLDIVLATVNYSMEGNGQILLQQYKYYKLRKRDVLCGQK